MDKFGLIPRRDIFFYLKTKIEFFNPLAVAQIGLIDEKKLEVENLIGLSLKVKFCTFLLNFSDIS